MRNVSGKRKKSRIIKLCFPKGLASLWLAPSRRTRIPGGEGSRNFGRGAGQGLCAQTGAVRSRWRVTWPCTLPTFRRGHCCRRCGGEQWTSVPTPVTASGFKPRSFCAQSPRLPRTRGCTEPGAGNGGNEKRTLGGGQKAHCRSPKRMSSLIQLSALLIRY